MPELNMKMRNQNNFMEGKNWGIFVVEFFQNIIPFTFRVDYNIKIAPLSLSYRHKCFASGI